MTASSVKRFDIRYLVPIVARILDKNTFAVKKLYVAVPVFNRYRCISEIVSTENVSRPNLSVNPLKAHISGIR